ncbi:MAG TPA: hypothetical protein VKW70_05690 [Terriglobia bacterium]|nr:hypothetical protein [Terriglobia bacterium]
MKFKEILFRHKLVGMDMPALSTNLFSAREATAGFRSMFSRRRFIETAAGADGLIAGSGIGLSRLARAAGSPGLPQTMDADDGPQHIPGGFANPALPAGCPSEILHFFGPGPMNENSTVWDFNGFIGVASGTVSGTGNLAGQAQSFTGVDVDMRFMKGSYVGLDGNLHKGAFAFI